MYRTDGIGLNAFMAKECGQQYLKTRFETDFCHTIFPCFDQPDLAASLKLSCQTESDWTVLSNDVEDEDIGQIERMKLRLECEHAQSLFRSIAGTTPAGNRQFIFKPSRAVSTYGYSIIAGRFSYRERHTAGLPRLRIYARPTFIDDVNSEEMFDVYEAGLTFYRDFMGVGFPFSKYDTVFAPERNYAATENFGCVTPGSLEGLELDYVHTNSSPSTTISYNESYIFSRETATEAKRLRFYISNLHELAHMWFGTLVSISWWDDVGMNEAISTYVAFLALLASPKLAQYHQNCWVTFQEYKFWGLAKDCLTTTHPICRRVHTADDAETLYDGIAYGKGPAFVKQIFNLLGHDVMRAGLQEYFRRYMWGHATFHDLVNCLELASGQLQLS